jgi:hypothetical protein
MGQLTQTFTEIQDMMNRQMMPFRQDLTGTNSIEITADTEVLWVNNGLGHENTSAPAYFTDRWDSVNNKMTAVTEYDHPTYVVDMGLLFTSDTPNSSGIVTMRIYIDESGTQDFSTDPAIRTYRGDYKTGSSPNTDQGSILGTWYWGEETGYDAKANGVYFTLEFEDTGDLTNPTTVIYNTQ